MGEEKKNQQSKHDCQLNANAYERYLKKAMSRYMIASKTQMHMKGI